jgi:hypothetical protein
MYIHKTLPTPQKVDFTVETVPGTALGTTRGRPWTYESMQPEVWQPAAGAQRQGCQLLSKAEQLGGGKQGDQIRPSFACLLCAGFWKLKK